MKRRSFLKTLAIALVAGSALLAEARPKTSLPLAPIIQPNFPAAFRQALDAASIRGYEHGKSIIAGVGIIW